MWMQQKNQIHIKQNRTAETAFEQLANMLLCIVSYAIW